MVGVFGAEMAVSFQSSGVGLKVGIFGKFRIAQFRLETAFGWSYLCVVMLWTVPMNCRILLAISDFRDEIFTKISEVMKWLGLSSFKIK